MSNPSLAAWVDTLMSAAEELPEGVWLFCDYGPVFPMFLPDGTRRKESMIQLRCSSMDSGLLAPMEEGKLNILVLGTEPRETLVKLLLEGAQRLLHPDEQTVKRIVEQRSGIAVQ